MTNQIFILRVPQGDSVRTYDSEINQCSKLIFWCVTAPGKRHFQEG